MINLFDSALLGLVEGLTEFLPVSSSGHLILARELLGVNTDNGLAFDAILQLGPIIAAVAYFWKDIVQLVKTAWKIVRGQSVAHEDKLLFLGILVGTVPAVILGLMLEKFMESTFRSAAVVALTLILGSALFVLAEKLAKQKTTTPSLNQSWWVGIFQSLALVPGISRSGATISGGLILGLTRETATRFSFLLSIPIIAGSGLLKLVKVMKSGAVDFTSLDLFVSVAVSGIVGYICIRWLIRYLKNHSLMIFVWYRLALAAVVLIALALRH